MGAGAGAPGSAGTPGSAGAPGSAGTPGSAGRDVGSDVGKPNFANPGIVGASGNSGIFTIGSVDLDALIAATTVGVINGTTKSLYNPLYEMLGIGTAGITFSMDSFAWFASVIGFRALNIAVGLNPPNPPIPPCFPSSLCGTTKWFTKNCLPSIGSLKKKLYGIGAQIPLFNTSFVIKSACAASHSTHKIPNKKRKILNTLKSFAIPCHVSPI
jgi:hypothetical protein